jgi:hypothetical protein
VARQRPHRRHELLRRSGLAAAIGEDRLYRSLADAAADLRAALDG